jgi:hypothetical protein
VTGSGFDRFQHHWPGYRAVMRSTAVRTDMQRRADAVARVVRGRLPAGNEGAHIRILADTTVGRNRAGATVIGVPMHLERKYRILGSAIDAAGGGS